MYIGQLIGITLMQLNQLDLKAFKLNDVLTIDFFSRFNPMAIEGSMSVKLGLMLDHVIKGLGVALMKRLDPSGPHWEVRPTSTTHKSAHAI